MSTDKCVAFYGVRFEIDPGDIESLETRSDSRIRAARKAGLKHYWGNFAIPGERYLLLIGAQLGILGSENSLEVSVSASDLNQILELTRTKLQNAGFVEPPSLHLQWEPSWLAVK